MNDIYSFLGLPRNTSEADLKAAYLKKAKELHPDHGGDPEQMRILNELYQNRHELKPKIQIKRTRSHFMKFSKLMVDLEDVIDEKEVTIDGTTFKLKKTIYDGYTIAIDEHYISIFLKPHRKFTYEPNRNLSMNLKVPLLTYLVGGSIEIQTLYDKINLKIPPNSTKILRVRGHGLPITETENGDLYIYLEIIFPKLSEEQKEKLKEVLEE